MSIATSCLDRRVARESGRQVACIEVSSFQSLHRTGHRLNHTSLSSSSPSTRPHNKPIYNTFYTLYTPQPCQLVTPPPLQDVAAPASSPLHHAASHRSDRPLPHRNHGGMYALLPSSRQMHLSLPSMVILSFHMISTQINNWNRSDKCLLSAFWIFGRISL
jgi:hypothetical protein